MNVIDPLAWATLLMVAGCALVILEVFVPSGGILGLLAATAVLSSIGLAFYHQGPTAGFLFSAVAVVAVPAMLALAFKYWPQTPMGKRFLLDLPTEEETLPTARKAEMQRLVGKIGVATCPMLPSGAIKIDRQIVDAISQGMPIDKGQEVRVIEARAYRVVVRPLVAGERRAAERPNDVLSQPLDALGLEPLDDPLA